MKRKKCSSFNVFEGPRALRDFLNPSLHPPIPLVELPAGALNPFWKKGIRIFAKAAYLLPLLNIKSLAVLSMLEQLEAAGRLKDLGGIVEASSGNTAFCLGVLARIFKIPRITAVLPWDIAEDKRNLIRLLGSEDILNRGSKSSDHMSSIDQAEEIADERDWITLGQYRNQANPEAIARWIAPQIWKQTKRKVRIFATALGSTGTAVGAKLYFKRRSSKVKVLGVACASGNAIPGARTKERLGEISFDWKSSLDAYVEGKTKESFRMSRELCCAGILGGPSSGLALVGLHRYIRQQLKAGSLDELRMPDGTITAVVISADTPLLYLGKYSTHFEPEDFAT
jgi:cysteine synthase A